MTTIQVPDYLKSVSAPESSSMISSGISVPRVSLRGSKFRWIKDGEEVNVQTEDIDIIILGVEPLNGMSKTFYINGYTPGSDDPPDCTSWDGIRPDPRSNEPQSDLCANCPQNKWGSAKSISGKKAKACKDSKKLIIVPANEMYGEYYILTVTISSLKALSEYGKWLAENNLPYSAVITSISFIDSDFPQIKFAFKSFLEEEDGKKCIAISQKRSWSADFNNTLPKGSGQKSIPSNAKQPDATKNDSPVEVNKTKKSTDELLDEWENN